MSLIGTRAGSEFFFVEGNKLHFDLAQQFAYISITMEVIILKQNQMMRTFLSADLSNFQTEPSEREIYPNRKKMQNFS